MTAIRICISLEEKNLKLIDGAKGLATRSAFIDYLITRSLSKKIKKQKGVQKNEYFLPQ